MLAGFLWVIPNLAFGDIYRYVDAEGVIHLTDRPTTPQFTPYVITSEGSKAPEPSPALPLANFPIPGGMVPKVSDDKKTTLSPDPKTPLDQDAFTKMFQLFPELFKNMFGEMFKAMGTGAGKEKTGTGAITGTGNLGTLLSEPKVLEQLKPPPARPGTWGYKPE
jgi:hypothetical protein